MYLTDSTEGSEYELKQLEQAAVETQSKSSPSTNPFDNPPSNSAPPAYSGGGGGAMGNGSTSSNAGGGLPYKSYEQMKKSQ